MPTPTPLSPPNPNDENSIKAHRDQVLSAYAELFGLIDQALNDSIPRASDFFRLLNGPIDLGVHAANTRYLTRLYLGSRDIRAEDEETREFELERIPNCGLCLSSPNYEIRILKASSDGVPKATSDARSRFYSSNQLQFAFANGQQSQAAQQITLNLVVLWSMDASHSYAGMEIACPRGENSDGTVDCYWIAKWQSGKSTASVAPPTPTASEADLDEIKPVRPPRAASE
jgi:hypothetical protein